MQVCLYLKSRRRISEAKQVVKEALVENKSKYDQMKSTVKA